MSYAESMKRLEEIVAALEAGWFLLQSPAPYLTQPGAAHGASYLPNEFIFVRSIEI